MASLWSTSLFFNFHTRTHARVRTQPKMGACMLLLFALNTQGCSLPTLFQRQTLPLLTPRQYHHSQKLCEGLLSGLESYLFPSVPLSTPTIQWTEFTTQWRSCSHTDLLFLAGSVVTVALRSHGGGRGSFSMTVTGKEFHLRWTERSKDEHGGWGPSALVLGSGPRPATYIGPYL